LAFSVIGSPRATTSSRVISTPSASRPDHLRLALGLAALGLPLGELVAHPFR
jgi:hypothetical protein